jgi:hypothetical protein
VQVSTEFDELGFDRFRFLFNEMGCVVHEELRRRCKI